MDEAADIASKVPEVIVQDSVEVTKREEIVMVDGGPVEVDVSDSDDLDLNNGYLSKQLESLIYESKKKREYWENVKNFEDGE